jgi:Ni/Fe-hydrogenase subunit HybB-like protein
MSDHELRDSVLQKLDRPLPPWVAPVLALLTVLGAATFLLMALGASSARAWRDCFVNWLFWTGLAQAGVVFSASQVLAGARWSHPLRRIAEASAAFLPISFVLFLLLWLGRADIFPWVRAPVEAGPQRFWLRDWFVFGRDGVALLVMYAVSFWYLVQSLRPDAALLAARGAARGSWLHARLARGWSPPGDGAADAEALARTDERQRRLAAALALVYAVVMSVLGFDLVMALAPHWVSALYGAYFFMGAWLAALMTLALATMFWRGHLGLEQLITARTFHDLGKLCFAFTVFWMYLFFSQFIVVWYGNLPEEISAMMLRIAVEPWRSVGIAMMVLVFIVPFWGLMGVVPKQTPAILGTFAVISLAGLWLDRWVFVMPSILQTAPRAPLGWPELLVTAGFAGLWGLSHVWFARTFPIVSPRLLDRLELEGAQHH